MSENQIQQLEQSEDSILVKETITVKDLLQYCLGNPDRDERLYSYNTFISRKPHQKWLKVYEGLSKPNKPYLYIPIGIMEQLLTYIYGEWRVEVMNVSMMADAATVTVRLHYKDRFVDNQWKYVDGIGACGFQKDKSNDQFKDYKLVAAQMAVPSAKTFAIKDAAESLGNIFGANLNRKDVIDFFSQPAPAQGTKQNTSLNL